MEKYAVEGTPKTPSIKFDLANGVLEIKGRSIPENSIEFYKPLVDALDKYAVATKPATTVNVQLEYFNTSSSKCILDVFKKLESINKSGSAVTINWHYEEDDEDMLEAGEDYQAIINVPFKMTMVNE
ncbi:MAG: DUF1987 domain-containing protein [Bacteroidetes bacterium]|nr:DUF1987 domain-containing protein [Bacteroidota bacterium]